jgi:glyoxylase-like metal-dependent hydrolase (beta-lactamase superfamily II)
MFDTERAGALASLDRIEALGADVLLPGHGPVHRAPVDRAARRARELAG